jgi:hypothetical protein
MKIRALLPGKKGHASTSKMIGRLKLVMPDMPEKKPALLLAVDICEPVSTVSFT